MSEEGRKSEWKEIHERIFTKWCNNVLKNGGHTKDLITKLQSDLKDGVKLIQLLKCLVPHEAEKLTYTEQPNGELENLETFFGYLKQAGITCASIGKLTYSPKLLRCS